MSVLRIITLASILSCFALTAAESSPVSVVANVKVLSNNIEDVSSIEAWKKSFIKDGMTDEEKAKAVWTTVVKFRHQCPSPREYLFSDGEVHDPIKTFNVYGYGICCCASSNIEALSRYAGLTARGWGINCHSVPEIGYDNAWHLFDASLICYFPKSDGKVASVEEISATVNDWLDKNPGYRGDDKKLREIWFSENRSGWKKGPDLLTNCPFYNERGWWPAKTHGWYSTMQEYDGSGGGANHKAFLYEYGYSQGYHVNIQLREGERLTRNWGHKGLHVNLAEKSPSCIDTKIGEGDLVYAPSFGDLANGRIGNGTEEYNVPLASGAFRGIALSAENLASKSEAGAGSALQIKDAANPGVLVLRMPSSYVYLSGALNFDAVVGDGGQIAVSFSDNNGLDWKEVSKVSTSGPQSVDLKVLVYRRYDYQLKFELKGKDTGLDSLKIVHDIQHSQRALPALKQGSNTITFSAEPSEGTITIEGATDPKQAAAHHQLSFKDFHPQISGVGDGRPSVNGDHGEVTFPISTPAEMTRIRFGCHYWAADAKDGWDLQVSFDDGKTFKTVDRAVGATGGFCKYVTFSDVPAGTKSALVRYAGVAAGSISLLDLRVDADYKLPGAGFRPVKITYSWDEDGQPKSDVHVAKDANDTYSINCAAKPVMKSIVLELAE
jgi:hypothetical protein